MNVQPVRGGPRGSRARREALLRSYVAPEVVAHILSDGREPLLSGVRLTVTILFADIRGFTRLADHLPAERVVNMLDEYFDAMTAAAVAHQAMIDKLIGDAIMLVFGVSVPRGDEAARALRAAHEMHCAFRLLLQQWRAALPMPLRLGLGIGCASGEAVLANVGSAVRMDYTTIGRPVNLAARLAAAAGSGVTLVNHVVREEVERSRAPGVRFGRPRSLSLKGFRGRTVAYPCRLQARRSAAVRAAATTDPVCGMKVNPQHALTSTYRRRTYYFCSAACRQAFRRDPRQYGWRASGTDP